MRHHNKEKLKKQYSLEKEWMNTLLKIYNQESSRSDILPGKM